jgi:thiamine-phosphate pyrophosphorylase
MDARVVGWARAVKKRRRSPYPVLWLFTDAARLADPLAAIARLPPGLAGVVFRHDGVAGRDVLGRRVAALCRARRLALVVAGDARLAAALRAGVHLRGGRWPGVVRVPRKRGGLRTASAHDGAQLRRAAGAGAEVVFLSPAFATASHPGGRPLGAARWARLAGIAGAPRVYALGGVDGGNVRRLGRECAGAGGIAGLASV